MKNRDKAIAILVVAAFVAMGCANPGDGLNRPPEAIGMNELVIELVGSPSGPYAQATIWAYDLSQRSRALHRPDGQPYPITINGDTGLKHNIYWPPEVRPDITVKVRSSYYRDMHMLGRRPEPDALIGCVLWLNGIKLPAPISSMDRVESDPVMGADFTVCLFSLEIMKRIFPTNWESYIEVA